ncbi:MAG: hypothetical protein MK116_13345 [Phycisphaerales bacterium]|nr:hypothetical protein [Phycisphaerales bacterium]
MTSPHQTASVQPARVTGRTVLHDWWPLAASWGLMGLEMPAISVMLGRLPDPEINLAAFGGIAFPLGLLVEAPIIMMLAASTALSRDLDSFLRLQRFMTILAIGLTVIHALLVFTPLWTWVVIPLLDIPAEVQAPAREAFLWLLPWTWAIADRRFRQGMLIRFGRREVVAFGTAIRLMATIGTLFFLAEIGVPGAVVATGSLSAGVIVEAAYVRFRSSPVVAGPLHAAPPPSSPLRLGRLLKFYIPLALTPILILTAQPVASAGMTRMPEAVASLAVWAPLGGLTFLFRSTGIAYNEVVIRLADSPGSIRALRRFAWIAGLSFSGVFVLLAVTPLAKVWFREIVALDEPLAQLGVSALWIAAPVPILTFLQSLYQGILVNAHRTRPITESVVVYLLITVVGLAIGVAYGGWTGLLVAMVTYSAANLGQTLWLFLRAKDLLSADGQYSPQDPMEAPEPA